jgi:hypothetical protein
MNRTFDPVAIAMSAIANVSAIPTTRADIGRMLVSGEGEPSHIMALYSDIDLTSLMRLAIAFDISDEVLARAYIHARDVYGACNPEMDDFAAEMALTERRE